MHANSTTFSEIHGHRSGLNEIEIHATADGVKNDVMNQKWLWTLVCALLLLELEKPQVLNHRGCNGTHWLRVFVWVPRLSEMLQLSGHACAGSTLDHLLNILRDL